MSKTSGRKSRAPTILFALIFLAAVGASVVLTGLPIFILAAYLAASFITFIAYAIDKSAARNGRRRISESTLHFFAFAGGWPGALIAQQTLRHKSQKQPFRGWLIVTIVLNCMAFAWLHTSDGRVALLRALAEIT